MEHAPQPATADEIARWNRMRGMGMTSAVGEYTPAEFWRVVDELVALRASLADSRRVAEQMAGALRELLRYPSGQYSTCDGWDEAWTKAEAALAAYDTKEPR